MRAARRPRAVAFDVIETLFSLEAVGRALEEEGAGPRALEVFFGRLLRDGFALAAARSYAPFGHVAREALAVTAPGLDEPARRRVLSAFASLSPHGDVRPALERLAAEAVPVAALANGSAETIGGLLREARLEGLVGRVISVDEVGVWKPAPTPYLHAAATLGVEPGQLAMVAVHAWDVHGAVRAGLVGGWASRLEGTYPPTFDAPDVQGADLRQVVDGLLALPDD
jgi:2-haloacid dehalogenase